MWAAMSISTVIRRRFILPYAMTDAELEPLLAEC
jgi:hypothetical protein